MIKMICKKSFLGFECDKKYMVDVQYVNEHDVIRYGNFDAKFHDSFIIDPNTRTSYVVYGSNGFTRFYYERKEPGDCVLSDYFCDNIEYRRLKLNKLKKI